MKVCKVSENEQRYTVNHCRSINKTQHNDNVQETIIIVEAIMDLFQTQGEVPQGVGGNPSSRAQVQLYIKLQVSLKIKIM